MCLEGLVTINSKQKGSDFERKVAKLLQKWSGYEFHRTPGSGSLHWENDKRVVSDIVPSTELKNWKFSIECKKVEKSQWEFSNLLDGTSMVLKSHWKQCYDDAKSEGLLPMLIFSKNRRSIFVMLPYQVFKCLPNKDCRFLQLHLLDENLIIADFYEFLERFSIFDILNTNFENFL